MRILIIGAGVAGLTLAAKLQRQGREPTFIERLPEYADSGYGISLWPLGSCVLHGLGVYDDIMDSGLEAQRFELADHTGQVLQRMDLSSLTRTADPLVTLPRSDLIRVGSATLPG
jgi:2-polyprenyl-6-methoxyphenol hydroxylase-like FAD-dependent oxidoreductase